MTASYKIWETFEVSTASPFFVVVDEFDPKFRVVFRSYDLADAKKFIERKEREEWLESQKCLKK